MEVEEEEEEEGRGGGLLEGKVGELVEVLLTFAAIVPQISRQTFLALRPCCSLLTFTKSCVITAITV